MAYSVANIPPVSCYVRKEYLRDLKDGHGEFTPAYWVTVKVLRRRAIYVEAFLPEYGALYDKLPISAFVQTPKTPKPDLGLGDLQLWDADSPQISVIEKTILKNWRCKFRTINGDWHGGHYLFTVDLVYSEPNEIDANLSRLPSEHKSYNFIKLDNGQFAAQPNNRVLWEDEASVYKNPKVPDFKVSTQEFSAEAGRWRLGDEDSWSYGGDVAAEGERSESPQRPQDNSASEAGILAKLMKDRDGAPSDKVAAIYYLYAEQFPVLISLNKRAPDDTTPYVVTVGEGLEEFTRLTDAEVNWLIKKKVGVK